VNNNVADATCSFSVTITDDEAPAITCAADVVMSNDLDECGALVSLVAPTTSDNCTVSTTVGVRSDGLLLTDLYPVGETKVTWTVTDQAGLTATCDQLVTISDVQKPIFTSDISGDRIICDGELLDIMIPYATDNCDTDVSIGYVLTGVTAGFGTESKINFVFNVGVTTVTFTATDNNDNSTSYSYDVTVNPNPEVTDAVRAYCADDVGSFVAASFNDEILDEGQNVADFTFAWSDGPLNVPVDGSSPAETAYSVQVTSNVTGCTADAILKITVNPDPALIAIEETFCDDDHSNTILTMFNTEIGAEDGDVVTWTDETGASTNETGDLEPGTYVYYANVTNVFNCDSETTLTIEIWDNPEVLISASFVRPVCGGYEGNILTATATPGSDYNLDYLWTITQVEYDNGWGFIDYSGQRTISSIGPEAMVWSSTTGTAEYKVSISDGNNCGSYAVFIVDSCVPENYCTYTQGFYGNEGGVNCTGDTDIIQGARDMMKVAVDKQDGDYVDFGLAPGNHRFRLSLDDITSMGDNKWGTPVFEMLPGGNYAKAIGSVPGVDAYASWGDMTTWNYVTLKEPTNPNKPKNTDGRIENQLLSQTMALWFNVTNNPNLGDRTIDAGYLITADAVQCGTEFAMPYTAQYYVIPEDVIGLLNIEYNGQGGATVGNLLDLANRYLGFDESLVRSETKLRGKTQTVTYFALDGNPSFSSVTKAVDAFNRGFDNCRIFINYQDTSPDESIASGRSSKNYVPVFGGSTEVEEWIGYEKFDLASGIVNSAYPNPFSTKTNIRFVLPQESETRVEVYSVDGVLIEVLFNEEADANREYLVEFNTSANSDVVYLYRIVTDYGMEYGKLIPISR
jgi:hypothetical protein